PAPEALVDDRGRWSVLYRLPWETPFSDLDLWEAHDFPLADPSTYPIAARFDGSGQIRRPDARQLADMEAALRALAVTTEAETDQGRWTHEVAAHDGRVRVTLAIPALLEPLDAEPSTVGTLVDRAQRIASEAMDAIGRRRIQLARRALEVSPD